MRNSYSMQYQRKRKSGAPIVFVLVLAICLVSVGIGWLLLTPKAGNSGDIPTAGAPADPGSATDITSDGSGGGKKPPSTVRIVGVGDDLIHSGVYLQAAKRAGGSGYDFNFTYENVADRIEAADIASVNQESPMSPNFAASGYPMFNSPTQVGEQMTKIGFDVMNLGNNHMLDMRESGMLSTLEFLRTNSLTQPIKYVGAFKDQTDYDELRLITKNDITFSFVGVTEMTNGLSLPKGSAAKIPLLKDETALKAQIEKAKAASDVVVVNAHWGVEYTHEENELQREMAQKMAEWGADIIFGHHPHVIQPVEYLTRADGTHAIVAYSLGNFICTQEYGPRMLGGMLDVTVKKDFETGKTVIEDAKFIPIVTHYEANYANVRNYYLEDYTKELADAHGCHERSQKFGMDYLYDTVKSVIDEQFLEDSIKNRAA